MNQVSQYKSPFTMKALFRNFTALTIIALIPFSGTAQIDRSEAPEAGPPPEVRIEDPHSFELENGLKVFVVEDHSLPSLSFFLLLDHDPVFEEGKKGYVGLTGSMLERGTENRSREEIAQEIDMMGASVYTSGNSIYAQSLRKHSGDLMGLVSDLVMNPTFPEEELEKLKKRKKSSIQQEMSNPSSIRRNVRKAVTYGKDHPYGQVETQKSIDSIEVDDCQRHYEEFWTPSTAYLAVVGDVEPEEAERMVRERFSKWSGDEAPELEYEDPRPPEKNRVALADKEAAVQSNLAFSYPVDLKPGDENVMPVELMNSILGGGGFSSRLMKNIREDKGYTYGVFSHISTDPTIGSFRAGGSVATNVTDSALTEFIKEMNKLRQNGVTEEELKDHKDRMGGGFTLQLEEPRTIARYAINIDRYDLDKDHYRNYLKRLDKVQKEEVDEAAEEYIKPENSHIVVVGDEDSLQGKLEKFGKVQRYDTYGFEKEKEEGVELPEDLTAKKVLEDYEKALGGKKAIEKIKDVRRVYKGEVQGREVTIEQLYKHEKPGGFAKLFGAKEKKMTASSMKMGGMTRNKSVYDGENAYTKSRGTVDTLEGEALKDQKLQADLFHQRNYLENGFEVEVLKGEMVDGEKAVALEIKDPSGETHEEYYSLENGLLLKEVIQQEGPQGNKMTLTRNYEDYEDFNGVKFPNTLKIDSRMPLEFKREKIQINRGLEEKAFQL